MTEKEYFKNNVFEPHSAEQFNELALRLFLYQAKGNQVYARYLGYLGVNPDEIKTVEQIPFLPISAFKKYPVITGEAVSPRVFRSSGTSKSGLSQHFVSDLDVYHQGWQQGFKYFYGSVADYCVLALLPSYLERKDSSLVYMAEQMINQSSDSDSAFYLGNTEELYEVLGKKIKTNKKTILLGVSFALLDFADQYQLNCNQVIIMETGGMKGRKKEMIRGDLHFILKKKLGVETIHSEYGMTELLSQAYSKSEGKFRCPPWMNVYIRQTTDAFTQAPLGKTGGLNVIDLANFNSCSFIETQDLGRKHNDGTFEVLGRFDHSEIRGCNLMID